ncbi:hypothetical protein GH5_00080 [Leishmania sp. Ghana 2012 LV757]|uniref:hypothetical protein n=1 Tax=Leishmania sp. Ghana 2012 LV757 TaxID=2803181 RepID=UPI001B46E48B|nr:hypothetical protein GH5_00080 [Leishmania sp. Ghana 2012 LV757]
MSAEKVLSEKLVLEKTKVQSLGDVLRLDMWGEGLTDISLVAKLPRLEVLALAANNVSSLKPLQGCRMLQELYLRKNKLANLREVTALRALPALSVLWLRDNPCAQHPYYREFVLHCCPGLRQLDGVEVTAEERKAAGKRMTTKALDEILGRDASAEAVSSPRPKKTTGTGRIDSAKASDAAPSSTPAGTPDGTAIIEERSPSGGTVLFTTVAAQRAMLLSIVSLLAELTVESLELLQREVHERIEKQKEKLNKYSQENSQ